MRLHDEFAPTYISQTTATWLKFKTPKSAFNATWKGTRVHSGRRRTILQLGELFNEAYVKSDTIENAAPGFKTSGICPFDLNVISPDEFIDKISETNATDENNIGSAMVEQNKVCDFVVELFALEKLK